MNDEYRELLKEALRREAQRKNYNEKSYNSPSFKELSEEEINSIHEKGLITPQEAVEEWESFDLCAPGNSGFNERCHEFNNCHDCLVDYANLKDEYTSMFDVFEEDIGFHAIDDETKKELVRVKK